MKAGCNTWLFFFSVSWPHKDIEPLLGKRNNRVYNILLSYVSVPT